MPTEVLRLDDQQSALQPVASSLPSLGPVEALALSEHFRPSIAPASVSRRYSIAATTAVSASGPIAHPVTGVVSMLPSGLVIHSLMAASLSEAMSLS